MEFLKKYQTYWLPLLGGILYAAGSPTAIGFTILFAPMIGFFLFNYSLALKENQFRKQFLIALLFSMGFYLQGFYWIPHTLQEFGDLVFPFNHLLGLFFSLVIIPQVYIYILFLRKIKNPIILSLIYVILEEYIPQQFPAHLGHNFATFAPEWPLRLAPYFGSQIYSFLTVLLALSILNHVKNKKAPIFFYGIVSILLILNFTLPAPKSHQTLPAMNVRLVQPNIGNFLKIDSEKGGENSLKNVFDTYYDLSTSPSSKKIDLIIWPETAFPTLIASELLKSNPTLNIPPQLSQIIAKTNAELFIGGYDLRPSSGRYDYESQYNSAFLFGSNQKLKDVYHKIHLIPFGEGLPFGPLNKILSRYITNVSYFAEGDRHTLFKTENNIPFVSAICYEILFSSFIRDILNNQESEPQFLINLTNDSWYGDTAEPHQHLFLAKWRALEFNLPIIRSTNTGITTVVNPDGSESKRLTYQEKKSLDVELSLNQRESTVYQRFGLWMIIGLAFMLFGIEKAIFKLRLK